MAYFQTKRGSLEESIRKAVINEEPKLDKVNPDAVKKKFKDRKDKDIDNDGDVDSTDKYLHKRRKAISKAMGEEISPFIIEALVKSSITEVDVQQLKKAADAARAASKRADDRADKMRALGKGDSELTKKLDKEAERKAAQARKFDKGAEKRKYARMDKAADKLDKGPKSKNPDVDDQGLTRSRADVVRQGNIVSKDAEKDRRRYAAGKQKAVDARQGGRKQGSVGATDRAVAKQGDAYDKYVKMKKAKGEQPLSRNDYLTRHGGSIKSSYGSTPENYDIGTPENTMAKLDATPGQSQDDWQRQVDTMQKKNASMREALAKVWGVGEGHNPFKTEDEHSPDEKKKKVKIDTKTMTGKPITKVEVDPDMREVKVGKKNVR